MVVLDKTRAWRYLHVVAALNWWKAAFYRHAWGDKDTWALAAVAIGADGGAPRHAGVRGSTVGWMARDAALRAELPTPVWGHVQFDDSSAGGALHNGSSMLYLNWQPHYAAGFVDMQPRWGPPGRDISCCVMLRDHWEGPHDEQPLRPTIDPSANAEQLERTFVDAGEALDAIRAAPLTKPHWWGQVRYRRCTIYFVVMGVGSAFAALSARRDWSERSSLRVAVARRGQRM